MPRGWPKKSKDVEAQKRVHTNEEKARGTTIIIKEVLIQVSVLNLELVHWNSSVM